MFICFKISSSRYSGIINAASITEPRTEIKTIKGKHLPGKTNADVQFLCFQNADVNYLPRGLNLIFPNLISLEIYNCGLKEISRKDLIGLRQLRSLSVHKNELTSLPYDLFVDKPNLKKIFFKDNKIEFMSSKLLEPIIKNDLEFVDFLNNPRIDEFFHYVGGKVD